MMFDDRWGEGEIVPIESVCCKSGAQKAPSNRPLKVEDVVVPTSRESFLDKVKTIVCKDRNSSYGEPEDSFQRIAEFWSTYRGVAFTPRDVGMMMTLLKVARGDHPDNYIDIAGYAACVASLPKE